MIQRYKPDVNFGMTTDGDGKWVEYEDADYWYRLAMAVEKLYLKSVNGCLSCEKRCSSYNCRECMYYKNYLAIKSEREDKP